MNRKWIASIFCFTLFTGFLLYGLILQMDLETKVDSVAMNDVLKKAERNWPALNQEDFQEWKYEFSIITNDNELIFSTQPDKYHTLNEAIRHRDTVVDVVIDQDYKGKIIFYNKNIEELSHAKNRLAITALLIFMTFAVLITLFILYSYHSIVKPFNRLQGFARHIARGHLDIPLAMDRHNLFGAYTESFDMMREELKKAKIREYEANISKKELVASLSHDIKTPVASIKAVSEFMLVTVKEAKVEKQLQTIYAKAEQIDRLVSDLFLSALEDLHELKVQPTEENSRILHEIIENTNFYDRIRLESIPECVIVVDVIRLQQIFDNIISNSYKYANTSINITFQLTDAYLHVQVQDYGSGVEEDDLPLLCTKFYRGRNAEGQNGSGLGLYISSYLIKQMDGDISFMNSEKGFTAVLAIKLA
ncbi:HAMP domain-containing sensor histidine kinase [Peribacillus sp. FSL H8-0477]|uniref:HAMP domain-containing sensor histidine kinase n=1 Tax=Peribacillus sp. FSL H8-0477 TaxID=2921388 RepID=UPI0030FC604E